MKLISSSSKNKKRTVRHFGYSFGENTYKSVLSQSADETKISTIRDLKLSKMELIKSPDEKSDALIFTYKNDKTTKTKVKELQALRDKCEFEVDSKIVSSFELLNKRRDIRKINLFDCMEEIKSNLRNDIRYAYRKFETDSVKNARHSVYIYHFYALIIATISMINELDFTKPVCIELKPKSKNLSLSFKSKSKRYAEILNKTRLLNIQGTEMRLEYIGALCREDDISNTFKIIDNTLEIEYIFAPIEKEGALYADVLEERMFFIEYMDIFNPIRNREVEAEVEE
jgi:hypothetical protein